MRFHFEPKRGSIIVRADLKGPSGSAIVRLALDTGATDTLINPAILVAIGYDPAGCPDRRQITTASGMEFVARLVISQVFALGQVRSDFPVLSHTLPPSASVDGLLGLDFLRDQVIIFDFREGWIELSA